MSLLPTAKWSAAREQTLRQEPTPPGKLEVEPASLEGQSLYILARTLGLGLFKRFFFFPEGHRDAFISFHQVNNFSRTHPPAHSQHAPSPSWYQA